MMEDESNSLEGDVTFLRLQRTVAFPKLPPLKKLLCLAIFPLSSLFLEWAFHDKLDGDARERGMESGGPVPAAKACLVVDTIPIILNIYIFFFSLSLSLLAKLSLHFFSLERERERKRNKEAQHVDQDCTFSLCSNIHAYDKFITRPKENAHYKPNPVGMIFA